ncbi:MAG: peptidylprolyl isomerase [Chthoniobacterales bacterium]
MKRLLVTLVAACALGVTLGQLLCRSAAFRERIGILAGRGHLRALARGHGIYDADLPPTPRNELALRGLIADAMARDLAKREKISPTQVDRACALIGWQFGNANLLQAALQKNRLSRGYLCARLTADLRAGKWLESKLSKTTSVTPAECEQYFHAHPDQFAIPERYRASHLFLAAPTMTPRPVVDQKRALIMSLSERIKNGENFIDLVAQTSEDESTRSIGGDLGYFSESRVPPDFFAAGEKLRAGEISAPIQTTLGFHIVQLTDFKPARLMALAEAEPEIRLKLENEKRAARIQKIAAQLVQEAEFVSENL